MVSGSIYGGPVRARRNLVLITQDDVLSVARNVYSRPTSFRPRLLLHGHGDCGQAHLAEAILHDLERYPVHGLDLPALFSDAGFRSPEEACVHVSTLGVVLS